MFLQAAAGIWGIIWHAKFVMFLHATPSFLLYLPTEFYQYHIVISAAHSCNHWLHVSYVGGTSIQIQHGVGWRTQNLTTSGTIWIVDCMFHMWGHFYTNTAWCRMEDTEPYHLGNHLNHWLHVSYVGALPYKDGCGVCWWSIYKLRNVYLLWDHIWHSYAFILADGPLVMGAE